MHPVQTMLNAVEELLNKGYWVELHNRGGGVCWAEAGVVHTDGFRECPLWTGLITREGELVVADHRI